MASVTAPASEAAPVPDAARRRSAGFPADDIWDAPDDGKRYEVIDGDLYVTTAPDLDHQEPVMALGGYIWTYLREHPIGWVYSSPVGLILDDKNGIQPDLVYVSKERSHILTRRGIRGTPDLIVEVLSPGTEDRDRGIKMRRFALAGVPHYWIVAPETRTLEAYRLRERERRYRRTGAYAAGEVFRPELFPGMEIAIADLWR
jgi:Uma2 family endonuclease